MAVENPALQDSAMAPPLSRFTSGIRGKCAFFYLADDGIRAKAKRRIL